MEQRCAVTRTTIMLPRELRSRAARRAKEAGVSMGQFVRQSIERALQPAPGERRGFLDLPVYEGPGPSDVSSRVDDYLYGERRDLR